MAPGGEEGRGNKGSVGRGVLPRPSYQACLRQKAFCYPVYRLFKTPKLILILCPDSFLLYMCNFGGRRMSGFEVIDRGFPRVAGSKIKPGLNRV